MSVLIFLILAIAPPPAAAADNAMRGRAEYIGGTVDGFAAGTPGLIKTSDKEYLEFITRRGVLKVHYQRVNLLEYGQQVSRRYAMAILISPMLILSKKKKHYLTVGYSDDEGRQHAMVFVVDKNDIRLVLVMLEARTGRRIEFQDEEARRAGRG